MNAEQKQKLFEYFQQEHDIMLLDGDFNEIENIFQAVTNCHELGPSSPVSSNRLTFDEAEELAKRCDYAFSAKGESPINWGDATGFFLEGYDYALKQISPASEEVDCKIIKATLKNHYNANDGFDTIRWILKCLSDEDMEKFVSELTYLSHPSLFTPRESVSGEVTFPTDEEIKVHFTVEHKPWKENPYYKILKDRIFGAKWMRDLIKQSHPSLFIHHGLTEEQRQEAFLKGWNAKENDTQGKSRSEYYEEWMNPKKKGE